MLSLNKRKFSILFRKFPTFLLFMNLRNITGMSEKRRQIITVSELRRRKRIVFYQRVSVYIGVVARGKNGIKVHSQRRSSLIGKCQRWNSRIASCYWCRGGLKIRSRQPQSVATLWECVHHLQ